MYSTYMYMYMCTLYLYVHVHVQCTCVYPSDTALLITPIILTYTSLNLCLNVFHLVQ